jgi:hypothetical protein
LFMSFYMVCKSNFKRTAYLGITYRFGLKAGSTRLDYATATDHEKLIVGPFAG